MAEFSVPDAVIVRPGESVSLGDLVTEHGDRFCRVKCAYRNLKTNEIITEVDDINRNDLTEGYHEWKKRHWRKLFDPFNIKIESVDIQMLPK